MEIRNLVTFVHVAELGSFTKAAKVLDYSQSTVSFQIKQLENELNCLLFERINHTISLTEKGKELLAYAQKISRLTAEFSEENKTAKGLKGRFHVVTPDSVCEDMILTNYATFHRTYPDIALKFTNTDTEEMFHMLDRNEADLIMTLDSHVYRSDYIIAKEEPVAMHFVTGADSPLAKAVSLSVTDIVNEEFILTEKTSDTVRCSMKNWQSARLKLSPCWRSDAPTSSLPCLPTGVPFRICPISLPKTW